MRIAENVEMLELGNGACNPVLTWSESDKTLALIDAGFPGQTAALIQAITDADFRAEDLTDIIITHQDLDHIGCVKDLLALAPKARLIAHEDEAPYIDGRKPPIKGFPSQGIKITQTVKDGDVLPICGGIEVVHTPGHTPGHICLLMKQSGVLVCGDAANIEDGRLVGSNPVYTHDTEQAARSLEKIKAVGAVSVVTYHCGYLELTEANCENGGEGDGHDGANAVR